MNNLYDILGINNTATSEDIKEAFREKAKNHHPDKGGDHKKMAEINKAYRILSDPAKKNRYDTTGEESPEASFNQKFMGLVHSIFMQYVEHVQDIKTTDIIQLFKESIR